MKRKSEIKAEAGKQELIITREFDLPVEMLFRAHVEPEIVEQWMGTRVVKLENRRHGGWQFETTDSRGDKHRFSGVIHEFSENRRIVRTFEFEQMPFGVQLEFLEFQTLTDEASRLEIRSIFESIAQRDEMLKLPFAQGLNAAHDRLQNIAGKLK